MPIKRKKNLRSQQWFNNPKDPEMTALYLERYLNYGLTRKELQSGNPIIGIAKSGSDLSPCNRHFLSLSKSNTFERIGNVFFFFLQRLVQNLKILIKYLF